MNELSITVKNGVIEDNFELVKADLDAKLNEYKNLVFTEESKKDAKDTVAELRKGQKAVQDRIKETKKQYIAPFEAWSEKALELVKAFDEPIGYINEQIEAFEAQRIEEKKARIRAIYAELNPDMINEMPLVKIYNPKWENATTTEKAIREEIMTKKEEVKTGLATIEAMQTDDAIKARAVSLFLNTYNLNESILLINTYNQQRAEIIEREQAKLREEAEERIRREEREKMMAEIKARQEVERQVELAREEAKTEAKAEAKAEAIEQFIPDDEGEAKAYAYTIFLNDDAKEKLNIFLDSIGIEYYIREM